VRFGWQTPNRLLSYKVSKRKTGQEKQPAYWGLKCNCLIWKATCFSSRSVLAISLWSDNHCFQIIRLQEGSDLKIADLITLNQVSPNICSKSRYFPNWQSRTTLCLLNKLQSFIQDREKKHRAATRGRQPENCYVRKFSKTCLAFRYNITLQ